MERTSRALRLWRLLHLGFHLARGMITSGAVLPWVGPDLRWRLIREWSRTLLGLLGIELTVRGKALDRNSRGVMVVANHVSWLDIYLLNTVCPVRFISKAEVRRWPVIGWLAEKTGTLFLEREKRRDAVRVNNAIAAALKAGDCVAFFPEGTTSDGSELRPFLASLLQPAIDAGALLQPAALRYRLPDGGIDPTPAYFGDMSMGQSLMNILQRKTIYAELSFAEPFPCRGETRRELARRAESVISSALNLAAPRTKPETPGR